MNKIYLSLSLGILALISCSSNSPQVNQTTESSNQKIYMDVTEQELISSHPAKYIELAAQLFKAGNFDESVFWYYVGQMRFRAHLEANPNLDPSSDPALYASLKYVVGTPLNEYAGGNPDNWIKLIEEAIEWNRKNPNLYTKKDQYPDIYKKIDANFNEFRDYVFNNKDEIRKQREENGLENR